MSDLSVPSSETSPNLAAIVQEVGPGLSAYRTKTSPDGMLTISFTDIEGSTEMLERMGEERWIGLISEHNRIVRECVGRHGGEVVKSQGDGFMIVFASASAALDCAVELQRTIAARDADPGAEPLRVRVGLHTGNIFQSDDDFLGRAVVLAARITGLADGGQILVSDACRRYTCHLGRWRYGAAEEVRLKGLARSERVFTLEWVQR